MAADRILCVDDSEDVRYLLATLLGSAGLEVVGVPEAEGALRLLGGGQRFVLYILDGELPGVSGLTLCERIRAGGERAPVVIFSGHGHESDRAAGMLAGADAYVVKPDTAGLVSAVRRLLQEARLSASAHAAFSNSRGAGHSAEPRVSTTI